jgi:cell division septation protein DedD
MKRIYTTAQGKQIDIESLRLANEESIAVGNMKVNARGDKLGAGGTIAETRNQTQDSYYRLNTPMPVEIAHEEQQQIVNQQVRSGARMSQGTPMPETVVEQPVVEEISPEVTPATVEDPVPVLRGSLAASLAAPVTVKQQLIPDPRKPTGPTRL